MPRYRKLPVIIDAIRWTGDNINAVYEFMRPQEPVNVNDLSPHQRFTNADGLVGIQTLEGLMVAGKGDWIIRGVQRELYPCKAAVFAATYEAVPDADADPNPDDLRQRVYDLLNVDGNFAGCPDTTADAVMAVVQPELARLRTERDEAEPYQVWPLGRVLAEVRCGSQDWSWEDEWADLDRRHADTGYLLRLEQNIRERGITMPVLIGSDGRLWDGHHRLRVAVRLGIGYVPVEITPNTGEHRTGQCPPACADGHMYDGDCTQSPLLPGVITETREHGRGPWAWSCDTDDGCGLLSLGHSSAAAARRAYDRHRKDCPAPSSATPEAPRP